MQILSRCGLRAGETFGLQRQDVNSDRTLSSRRTFSRGEIGPPKTKTSATRVALPKPLHDALTALLAEAGPVANRLVVPVLEETPQGEDADIAGSAAW